MLVEKFFQRRLLSKKQKLCQRKRFLYQIEAIEDISAVAQNFPAQPAAHDEEGNSYGQQLHTEGKRLFLKLGDGLNEA